MKNLEKEIEKKARELNRYKTKLIILDFISKSRYSIESECKEFGISKRTYYNWKRKYERDGPEGLKRKKPTAYNHPNKISEKVVDKILELRKVYQLGSIRITCILSATMELKSLNPPFIGH